MTSKAMAFMRSGRLSVTRVMWSRGFSTVTKDMAGILATFRPPVDHPRGSHMSEPVERPKTSTRDLAATHDALEAWLSSKVGEATITELQAPPTNGMSSETILFEATWDGATTGLVGRIPPDPANKPVF